MWISYALGFTCSCSAYNLSASRILVLSNAFLISSNKMYSMSNKSLVSGCFYSFIAKQKVIKIFLWVSVKVASKCFKLKK